MKIDSSKNSAGTVKDPNIYQTPTSLFESPAPAAKEPPATGFAKILDEKRQDEKTAAKNSPPDDDRADSPAKADQSESAEKVDRTKEEKRRNRGDGRENGDQPAGEEDNVFPWIAPPPVRTGETAADAPSAARQILHVADLERIVSTIRGEAFQTEKRVTIALKNSILEGLQIRLTVNENGRLKAEFLALDEQIRKQLNQRKNELSEILRQRSKSFSEIEVVFSEPRPDEKSDRPGWRPV